MPTPNSLIDRLFYYAQRNPAHDALVSAATTLSYKQLAEQVVAQTECFETVGVTADSVIGIRCADNHQHLVLCLAAAHIGATSCTIPSFEAEQAQVALGGRCHITHLADGVGVVSAPIAGMPQINASGPTVGRSQAPSACLLFSTSGTTGEPKLVVHHDSDLVAQAHRHVESNQERFACLASMEHNFVKRHRLYAVAAGATNVFLDSNADTLVAQCLALAVNVLHVSAFQAQELLAQPNIERLGHIRLKLGGGHVPLRLRQQLREQVTNNLQAGYGTTETGAIGFTDPTDRGSGESVGRPLPGIEVRMVCAQRKTLGVGERGEVAIRCKGMFREYVGNPELTAARLHDGWFYTGDLGYLDQQQRIHLCGRSDDMFVFNSMNIYPQEIESTILQHQSIADAAVIPKASPVHGDIPVALLVFKKNAKTRLGKIEKYVQKRLGARSPRQYIIVPEIPKTAAGKLSRSKALSLPNQSEKIRSAILGMLNPRVTEDLKPALISAFEDGDEDILLKNLAMDSLDRMNFLVSLELEFDTIIRPQDLPALRYMSNVVAQVLSPPPAEEIERTPVPAPGPIRTWPKAVRFFQRVFGCCHTVAQLNRALLTLESRLTPLDVQSLYHCHMVEQLIPIEAAEKFQVAVSGWLKQLTVSMLQSGKERPEPFSFRRVAPNINYFSGPGPLAAKTLLICFPPRDIHQMEIPNPIFLQHADAERFDVLIVSSPFTAGYQRGKSRFEEKVTEFRNWLITQCWAQEYRAIRTLGFSAGARTAISTGHLIGVELAVSVSGRFHRKRHVLKNLDQLITIWKTARKGRRSQVLLSYTAGNPRDRKFANIMARIADGKRLTLEHQRKKLQHLVFQQLLAQGELGAFLDCTVYADRDAGFKSSETADLSMRFV